MQISKAYTPMERILNDEAEIQMRILIFKSRRMRIEEFILSVGT